LRQDDKYMFVSAWEFKGDGQFELHKEPLNYEVVHPSQRSYK
jgi:succinate dehydrogenase / fumarate reductase flavoprotein subunit